MIYNDFTKAVTGSIVAVIITLGMATGSVVAAEDEDVVYSSEAPAKEEPAKKEEA